MVWKINVSAKMNSEHMSVERGGNGVFISVIERTGVHSSLEASLPKQMDNMLDEQITAEQLTNGDGMTMQYMTRQCSL